MSEIVSFVRENFNNREFAIYVWSIVFTIWVFTKTELSSPFGKMLKLLFTTQIFLYILILYAYLGLVTYLLSVISIWNVNYLKGTIYWCFGSAFMLFLNVNMANENPNHFRNILKGNVKITCVIQYIVGLHVFSFFVELVVIPILSLLAIVKAVAERKEAYRSVDKLINLIFVSYGCLLFMLSIINIYQNAKTYLDLKQLIDFVMPILYTILILPLLYLFALKMAYEDLFVRLKIFNRENPKMLRRAQWLVFLKFNLQLGKMNRWVENIRGNYKIIDEESFKKRLENTETIIN